MHTIRKLGEVLGRACMYGEMLWVALLAQALLWLQVRLFPVSKRSQPQVTSQLEQEVQASEQANWTWLTRLSLVAVVLAGLVLLVVARH